ncbi:MAG: type I restriction enzyme HsdR N-terminal domain-containing protein [Cytophagales bacterium]|nr:MAG: type I restriction enzyme HsdR N-terminal domain-containing protein [Cytophagales bacterium]
MIKKRIFVAQRQIYSQIKPKIKMFLLQIPEAELDIIQKDQKLWVWDIIRQKHVILTPEEYVRQELIHYFVEELGYPKSRIGVEKKLEYTSEISKRTDIVVYDAHLNPWLLVECKSTEVMLNEDAWAQIATYQSILQAPYLALCNGIEALIGAKNQQTAAYELIEGFPMYPN